MPETAITRTEILIVDKTQPHVYQGQTDGIDVFCKDGSKHRVNVKHKDLWQVFQQGQAVEVGYGSYMDKEFIHTARQVKDGIRSPVATAPVNVPPCPPQTVTQPKEHLAQAVKAINSDTKDRAVALAYSKDLAAAGKIGLADIYTYADKFLKYILNQ